MKLLADIEHLGYRVILKNGDTVRLEWAGQGVPPAETVRPLLDELRQRKPEAVAALRMAVAWDRWETHWQGCRVKSLTCPDCDQLEREYWERWLAYAHPEQVGKTVWNPWQELWETVKGGAGRG